MSRLLLTAAIAVLMSSQAVASTSNFCNSLMKYAFDTTYNSESDELYETAFDSLKKLYDSLENKGKFASEVSSKGMSAAYSIAAAAYEDSSGKRSGEYSVSELFQSLSRQKYRSFAKKTQKVEQKRQFNKALTQAVLNCSTDKEARIFFAYLGKRSDKFFTLKLNSRGIGERLVTSFAVVPKGALSCGELDNLKKEKVRLREDDEAEFICIVTRAGATGIKLRLDDNRRRVVLISTFNKIQESCIDYYGAADWYHPWMRNAARTTIKATTYERYKNIMKKALNACSGDDFVTQRAAISYSFGLLEACEGTKVEAEQWFVKSSDLYGKVVSKRPELGRWQIIAAKKAKNPFDISHSSLPVQCENSAQFQPALPK